MFVVLLTATHGNLQVQTHCYEALDIDNFVRVNTNIILLIKWHTHRHSQLSHEFQFEVAAFHHAHEAYLVPDVLKRAYGNILFQSTMLGD